MDTIMSKTQFRPKVEIESYNSSGGSTNDNHQWQLEIHHL